MRKVIVCNIMSLDGYCTGPAGNVMVMPMDHAFDAYNAERLRAADTLLLGRRSFEGFRGYWPPVKDDPGANAVNREISRLNGAIDKIVVSDTLERDIPEPWSNTEVVRRADAHRRITSLRRESGGDILIFGSRTLWNDLMAHDLVDELHLMLGHVVAAGGTPLFATHTPRTLRLVESRTWEGSENVLVRYEVRHSES